MHERATNSVNQDFAALDLNGIYRDLIRPGSAQKAYLIRDWGTYFYTPHKALLLRFMQRRGFGNMPAPVFNRARSGDRRDLPVGAAPDRRSPGAAALSR